MRSLLLLSVLLTSLVSWQSLKPAANTDPLPRIQDENWQAPDITHATSVRRGRDGSIISWGKFLEELSTADAVFLGETHVDETTHRVELAVYQGLLKSRSGKVVLAMEMFERDEQAALDRYLHGEVTEREFLKSSRPWSNYRTAYRPMIELAKKQKSPVVAANFPRPMRRLLARGGMEALKKLAGDKKKQVPAEIKANTKSYWRRVDNAVRGHIAMMRPKAGDDKRLLSTQTLWDNSMGESCALALDHNPGFSVMHVNGGFHTLYWSGTARQFKLRKPKAKMFTVDIRSTANPNTARLTGAPTADYVVFAEARARDLNEGKWAVHTDKEIEYLLHMPKGLAADQKVPLMIWFTDDGLTAKDGMRLWKKRLGNEAVIAVVESPYPAVQFDMGEGGRWFWPDSFSADMGALNDVIERIWGYVSRYYPVDPQRLVVAGEGTGATVASSAAILSSRMDMDIVAFSPRRYTKIKDFSLPLPEFRGDDPAPKKRLHMVLPEGDKGWWTSELAEYETVGIKSAVHDVESNPWAVEVANENVLRSALGLKEKASASQTREHIVASSQSPRARYWARVLALEPKDGVSVAVLSPEQAAKVEGSTLISTKVKAARYKSPFSLPLCPGPFGGTTVVVLPKDISDSERDAWVKILDSKPLNKVSRFHRLRLAMPSGEHGLLNVLKELKEKGRKNVLVVPANFCADAAMMQGLSRSVEALEDQMTIHWSPGLGGK